MSRFGMVLTAAALPQRLADGELQPHLAVVADRIPAGLFEMTTKQGRS